MVLIKSVGRNIYLQAPPKSIDYQVLEQYIPDAVFVEDEILFPVDETPTLNRLNIVMKNLSNQDSYTVAPYRTMMVVPEKTPISPFDVFALVSRNLEYLYVKGGQSSIHSSALSVGDSTLLITGGAGCGKTTLMTSLLEEHGDISKIISGDRTVLKGNELVGGTKVLNYRMNSLRDEFPNVYRSLEGLLVEHGDERVRVTKEKSPFNYETKPRRVTAVLFPNKHPGKFSAKELGFKEKYTRFFNQTQHFLDEFPRILLTNDRLVRTPITDEQREKVLYNVWDFVYNTPCYALGGGLPSMNAFIEREILIGGMK